ncbi:hypothetical protein V5P93_004499 [Actinokineospora auranticolor]|uniref:Novel STAND NTPase 1 domain-containing protein n=1 Tax=Actinokineospora auranticolor TaxID=155976 RepID=A0A2S6GT43_9PSEU|nr:hypothetical protein [Actinokineospora auranticolor]PPK68394.1 hypothetical protein CLV40_105117 [Actinokineospora auranticolor]
MARPERPVATEDAVLTEFAEGLRELRRRSGAVPYRVLSARAHYSAAALSEAAGGRKLPTLPVTLAYVSACGGDAGEWERRWRAAAAHLVSGGDHAGPVDGSAAASPYPGLVAFHEGDADLFFGRDRAVDDLLDRLTRRRFLGLFGASGSGKTSVLRAGLATRWATRTGTEGVVSVLTPGARPAEKCAVWLAGRSGDSPVRLLEELRADPANLGIRLRSTLPEPCAEPGLLLIVDQFEEVFTLCDDDVQRAWFIRALVSAAGEGVRVVLGVRADFYGHCGLHGDLVEALQDGQVLLAPMTPDELRQAVTKPATARGYRLEPELMARVIADAAGRAGSLPLLSHALLETWRRRRGMTLTLGGYETVGGIDQAIVRTAEAVYAQLGDRQRGIAMDILTRLVVLGEGGADTKRHVRLDEWDDDKDTAAVVHALARARLVTLDHDGVDLAHEAVITQWARFRAWLTDNRENLRVHRQLVDAARTWEDLDRDPAALYRGTLLARACQLRASRPNLIAAREARFLAAAEDAHSAAKRTTRRRRRRIVIALASLIAVLATAGVYVARLARESADNRTAAMLERVMADARNLRASDPALAGQLALVAYEIAPSHQTRGLVLDAAADVNFGNGSFGLGDRTWIGFHPGGRWMYALSGGVLTAVDFEGTSVPGGAQSVDFPAGIEAMVIDSRGPLLAATDNTGTVRLLSIADPLRPRSLSTIATKHPLVGISFSPVAPLMALTYPDGWDEDPGGSTSLDRLTIVDVSDPSHPVERAAFTTADLPYGFDAGGDLVTLDRGGNVRLRDPLHPDRPREPAPGAEPVWAQDLLVARTRRLMATAGTGDPASNITLWDTSDPARPRPAAHLPGGRPTAFSPDGRLLAVTDDERINLWDVADLANPHLFAVLRKRSDTWTGLSFNANGTGMASRLTPDQLRYWSLDVSAAVNQLCQRAHPRITEDQWARYIPELEYRLPCE